jgi:hypothetical protein
MIYQGFCVPLFCPADLLRRYALPIRFQVWAYGNCLSGTDSIACLISGGVGTRGDGGSGGLSFPVLDSLWLEGNQDLGPDAVSDLLSLLQKGGLPKMRSLGLDLTQVRTVV